MKENTLIWVVALMLVGCESSPRVTSETPECRQAKAENSLCYGDCLTNTAGGFWVAASHCGNVCRVEVFAMSSRCR